MTTEYLATLSVYDFRYAYFKQALLFFDRLVIPVPTKLHTYTGNLTQAELDRLRRDTDELEEHAAAVRLDWEPEEFGASLRPDASARDLLFASRQDVEKKIRLQLVQKIASPNVHVDIVPLLPPRIPSQPEDAKTTMVQDAFNMVLVRKLPIPLYDIPKIIKIRKSIKEELQYLRWWEADRAALAKADSWEDFRDEIREFEKRLEDSIATYKKIIKQDQHHHKLYTIATTLLAISAATALHSVAPGLQVPYNLGPMPDPTHGLDAAAATGGFIVAYFQGKGRVIQSPPGEFLVPARVIIKAENLVKQA